MNSFYILFYISSIVITGVFTVIIMERKSIVAKWVAYKQKRSKQQEERIKAIVLEYLTELRNGEINDITE